MNALDMAQALVMGGASVAALGIIGRAARSVLRVHDQVDRVYKIVLAELVPNHGGAMIDAVNRIEIIVSDHEARLRVLEFSEDNPAGDNS